MKHVHQARLKPLNSLAVEATADVLIEIDHWYELDDLEVVHDASARLLCLGEGSNILFVDDFPGTVLRIINRGISVVDESDDELILRVAAGENWHQLVTWSVNHDLWGLENLALIPGSVGAAPIQNIGAYGVELSDTLHSVQVYDRHQSCWQRMAHHELELGYRDSLFKRDSVQRYVITEVCFRLGKRANPVLTYPGLIDHLDLHVSREGGREFFPFEIAEAVSAIRRSKLPDPTQLPNAGSFFKNPQVSAEVFQTLKHDYPDMPGYPVNGESDALSDQAMAPIKLSAGWLIEQAGWKGHRLGDAGVAPGHALVMVNHGSASGQEVWSLAQAIQADVRSRFGVSLHPEPRVIESSDSQSFRTSR